MTASYALSLLSALDAVGCPHWGPARVTSPRSQRRRPPGVRRATNSSQDRVLGGWTNCPGQEPQLGGDMFVLSDF